MNLITWVSLFISRANRGIRITHLSSLMKLIHKHVHTVYWCFHAIFDLFVSWNIRNTHNRVVVQEAWPDVIAALWLSEEPRRSETAEHERAWMENLWGYCRMWGSLCAENRKGHRFLEIDVQLHRPLCPDNNDSPLHLCAEACLLPRQPWSIASER